jgi:excisionase family DNA binding protein
VNDSQDLTIAQTASILQVSPRTIHRWIKAGTLHAYRVGFRSVRIRPEAIERIKLDIPTK